MDDDHLTLVKPRDRKHDVYAGVQRFLREVLSHTPPGDADPPPLDPPDSAPPATTDAAPVGRPRVYVSYTLRTLGLRDRVLELAERLRAKGIDSRMDLFYAKSLHGFTPPDPLPNRDSWDAWQEEEIRSADRVLVVCTKEFSESAESSGVGRDLYFMRKDVEAGAPLRKFIPVGYERFEVIQPFIPTFIRGATYYDLSSKALDGFGFDDVVRRFRTEFASANGSDAGPSHAPQAARPSTADVYDRALRLLAEQDYDMALEALKSDHRSRLDAG